MTRVLVIDDGDDDSIIARAALEHEGYEVLSARSVPQGFAMARAEQPDLIVVDLRFDGEYLGFDLIRALQADPRTKDTPLLVYSSFTDAHTSELRELRVPQLMKRGATRELTSMIAAMLGRLDAERGG